MAEPEVLSLQFDEGGIAFTWMRESDQSEVHVTYHTTNLSREALEADGDLTYWHNELKGDLTELLMAWLKTQNRSDRV